MDLKKVHDEFVQQAANTDYQITQTRKSLISLRRQRDQIEGGLVVLRAQLTETPTVDKKDPSTWPWFSTLKLSPLRAAGKRSKRSAA